jgi:uroporphyrinogen-III synthase
LLPLLPPDISIISIGRKTTESLKNSQQHVAYEAPEHNTESLLQTTEFLPSVIKDQSIVIFRGMGGRALLGDTLIQRGARVTYIETYRRGLPPLEPLSRQQIQGINAITVSSNEGLDNLMTLMHGAEPLLDIPLVVPSQRAATLAGSYGFKTVLTAANATDEAMLSALADYYSTV